MDLSFRKQYRYQGKKLAESQNMPTLKPVFGLKANKRTANLNPCSEPGHVQTWSLGECPNMPNVKPGLGLKVGSKPQNAN